jgi:hypothetical protein
MLTRFTKWSLAVVLAALVLCTTATAQSRQTVALGSDFLQTQPGSNFNFGPGIGVVDFMGLPLKGGQIPPGYQMSLAATDTIVQRQADAFINGNAIPIQLMALSMESTAPVNVGGSFFDVFVTLDPANLANDVGMMSIMGSLAGGTFNSFFDVFFDAHFAPVGTGQPFDVFSSIMLSQNGAAWSPTPPANAVIVTGPFGDQFANTHTGLPSTEVDFWPCAVTPCSEDSSGAAHHVVSPATPEPSTLLLLGPAGFGLLWKLRARRPKQV